MNVDMNSVIGIPTTNIFSSALMDPRMLITFIVVILIVVILFSGFMSMLEGLPKYE